jgi:serine/threonine protein kinase
MVDVPDSSLVMRVPEEADARSDIWAFGAVLYEMLTGTRAFGGFLKDAAPPVSRRQPLAPATLGSPHRALSREGPLLGLFGTRQPLLLAAASIVAAQFAISRDGLSLGFVATWEGRDRLWVLDLSRDDRHETRFTSDRYIDASPMWSPDGTRIYFRSNRRGLNNIYVKLANASREEVGTRVSAPLPVLFCSPADSRTRR